MAIVQVSEVLSGADWTTTNGTPGFDATGMLIDTTGGAATAYLQDALAGGTRAHVAQLRFRVDTAPAAICNIYVCVGPTNDMRLQLTTGRVLRIQCRGGTAVTGATLAVGQDATIDLSFDTSGTSSIIAWAVDGVAQTGSTIVAAAADMTFNRCGLSTSTTAKLHYRHVIYANALADYPLPANDLYPIGSAGYYAA